MPLPASCSATHPPPDGAWVLAIETSTRRGEVALGRWRRSEGQQPPGRPPSSEAASRVEPLATRELSGGRRHNVELMPAIDAICREHGVGPGDLAVLAVSLGPGSFTGLRSGITAAKLLAWSRGLVLIGVPTLDVLAQQAAADHDRYLVQLNHKRGEAYAAGFESQATTANTANSAAPAPAPPHEWLSRGLYPEADLAAITKQPDNEGAGLPIVTTDTHPPRAATVLTLAPRFAPVDPTALVPLYIRIPEAVEQWERRKSERAANPKSGKA